MTTILVVDDSHFSRGRVIAAISSFGFRILEAGDGQTGLDVVEQHAPDVVITDLLMPTLDGFGLLRGLRDRGRQIPVIVVTADIQATSRTMCEELGAVAFVNKPFQAQELAALVQQFVPSALTVG
jgi:CheY-like chemotaxis protein